MHEKTNVYRGGFDLFYRSRRMTMIPAWALPAPVSVPPLRRKTASNGAELVTQFTAVVVYMLKDVVNHVNSLTPNKTN